MVKSLYFYDVDISCKTPAWFDSRLILLRGFSLELVEISDPWYFTLMRRTQIQDLCSVQQNSDQTPASQEQALTAQQTAVINLAAGFAPSQGTGTHY